MTADTSALVAEIYERELSPEEFEAQLEALRSDEGERANIDELIAWFTKRYPTMEARLAYARRHGRSLRHSR